jgi:hypothetical protein
MSKQLRMTVYREGSNNYRYTLFTSQPENPWG